MAHTPNEAIVPSMTSQPSLVAALGSESNVYVPAASDVASRAENLAVTRVDLPNEEMTHQPLRNCIYPYVRDEFFVPRKQNVGFSLPISKLALKTDKDTDKENDRKRVPDVEKLSLNLAPRTNNPSKIPKLTLSNVPTPPLMINRRFEPSMEQDYDIRDTTRKEMKVEYFRSIMSQISENLFIGSDEIAKNREILLQHKITHVVNCAGNVCENYWPNDFTYKKYYLKDDKQELIDSVLLDALEFMDNAIASGGRVYVHCIQGVSRSAAMIIGYLMWSQKLTYDQAYTKLRECRGVCNPNIGFMCRLIDWSKRTTDKSYGLPRVYRFSPHFVEQSSFVVPKLINSQNGYQPDEPIELDSRGYYLIVTADKMYIWQGKQCLQSTRYKLAMQKHVARLSIFEALSLPTQEVIEGQEPENFFVLFTAPVHVRISSRFDFEYGMDAALSPVSPGHKSTTSSPRLGPSNTTTNTPNTTSAATAVEC
eukprot:GILJ01001723.1.p1 GENE.GILJ01001723.1~~GILJ01001723.1.p1  ORF type:complete len:480 (-),score=54.69 GILJ01001723.1:987-2426(-)